MENGMLLNDSLNQVQTDSILNWFMEMKPIKPTVSLLMHEFLRPLKDQHDQNVGEKSTTWLLSSNW